MPTISAYTSDALKRRIDRIVKEEGRNQAQVSQSALALYASLPSSARRALHELTTLEEQTGEPLMEQVITDFTRALLNAKWEISSRLVEMEGRSGGRLSPDMSEEEIAELAVRMTREARER